MELEPIPTPARRPSVIASAAGSQPLAVGSEPLITRLHTHDVDEQAENLHQWDQTYVQLSPGRFEGRLIEAWFGDIHFFRETTNQVIHQRGRSRPASRTFCIPVSMDGMACFRGSEWGPRACATMGGDVEFDLRTSRRLDVIGVSFRAERLAAAACEHDLDPAGLERWLAGSCSADLPAEGVEPLRRMLLEVALMVESRSVLLRHPGVCASIEAAIHAAFVRLMASAVEVRKPHGSHLARRRLVSRAIDLVAAHPDALLTVSDLCRMLEVSRRTLQLYFEDVLQVSPLQYLRAFRLGKVRALIQAEAGHLRVQDAAARWGFWHLSQFSRDYRRLFGELPSQTLLDARRAAAPEAPTGAIRGALDARAARAAR